MMIYTGIGSRTTPPQVLSMMTACAVKLAEQGVILRSGGAIGADTAFERGAAIGNGPKEIYIPWNGFNDRNSREIGVYVGRSVLAEQIAEANHPNWKACSAAARNMHTRNVFQILGKDLKTPTLMVICYTEHGRSGGGTGQAIRIAQNHNIPVYDMGKVEIWGEISSRMGF